MAKKASQTSTIRTFRVRFVRPVKTGGRWYDVGDEVVLSSNITKDFIRRGLVEKLSSKSGETGKASTRGSQKAADRSASGGDRNPHKKLKDSRGVKK